MEKPIFEFNVNGKAYEERLKEGGHWEKFDLLLKTARTELRNHEADYVAHREKRIDKRKTEIAAEQQKPKQELKVKGGPVKKILTTEQIHERAGHEVERDHKSSGKELFQRHHRAINEFVRQALRLPKDFEISRSGWLREFDRGR